MATAISVALPFIFGLISPQQSQDLYTGWALHQNGQMYTDYFGTEGIALLCANLPFFKVVF